MSTSEPITEKQMIQLRRLGVGVFVIYKAGLEAENFTALLKEAAEGFSTRHALALDVTQACLGHIMSELTQRNWALLVLRRNDRYISGAIMDEETIRDDKAVIDFVREGLSQVPASGAPAGGGNGEIEIFGEKE